MHKFVDNMIEITLPDGSQKSYESGSTPLDIARSISHGLARNVVSAKFDGKIIEATTPLVKNGKLVLLTFDDKDGKKALWHSAAHLMAQAILKFYPEAQLTIGPPIDQGFYYDIDFGDETLSEKDFPKIEKTMLEIARQKHEFSLREVSKQDALDYYKENPFKTELIQTPTYWFYKSR
mgnify:CR=1 FL=1